MLPDPYLLYLLAAVLLLWGATHRDRAALGVVVGASVVSWLLVTFVTRSILSPWKLVVPGAVETLTIISLLRWSRGRTCWLQIALVSVAWLTHVLDYLDLVLGTNMVYDNYGGILWSVSLLQLLACYDTYLLLLRRFGRWWFDVGNHRAVTVRGAGLASPLLHHPRPPGL